MKGWSSRGRQSITFWWNVCCVWDQGQTIRGGNRIGRELEVIQVDIVWKGFAERVRKGKKELVGNDRMEKQRIEKEERTVVRWDCSLKLRLS